MCGNKVAVVLMTLFLIGSLSLSAQQGPPPGPYRLLSDSGRVMMPFELVGNHVVLSAEINGRKLGLILDTGMPAHGAILYGGPLADELGLKYVGQAPVLGAGGDGKPILADVAMGVTIGLPALELTDQMVVVMPYDSCQHQSFVEEGKDGIIGYALFSRFAVGIDYDNEVITLTEPDAFRYEGSGQELPITFRNRFPFITCMGEMLGGARISMDLVVDIGHGHALSLNVGSDQGVIPPENAIETRIGVGVGGEVLGHVGRIKALHLGKYELRDLVTSFRSAPRRGPAQLEKEGNLGAEALRRFNVIFDYANDRMILEPNSHFKDQFDYDMSGMVYSKTGEGMFRIDRIIPNSPASEAGLKVSDVLVEINGRPANQFRTTDLSHLLRKEGEEIALVISRGGERIESRLKLCRLI